MAKSTKKTDASAPEASDPASAGVAAAMAAFNPLTTSAWSELMQENMRFLTERLEQDLETQRAMLACRTPQDLMQVQSEFLRNAFAQYTQQSQRIMQMMGGAVSATAEDAKPNKTSGDDDLPV